MYCNKCGKEVSDGSPFCPYCGAQLSGSNVNTPATQAGYQSAYQKPMKKTNGWGVTGFVFALIGIFAGSLFGIVPAIAFICSVVGTALRHRRTSCNALAVWGLVLSIISLIVWIVIFAFFGTLLSW